jgi:hypothetical protein
MLLISVGIGFLLLFGVLISDGISGSSPRSSSIKTTDTSSRTRTSEGAAEATSLRPRPLGAHRPDDGISRAA